MIVTSSIFDKLYISDIADGYAERYDGFRTYFFELDYNIDNDWINDDMINAFLEQVAPKTAQLPSQYIFNLLVFGFDKSYSFNQKLDAFDQSSDVIKKYVQVKKEQINKYKTIKVVLTMTPIGEEKEEAITLGGIKAHPMSALEIYNVLFNMLNPTLYRDDLKAIPYNYAELANPTISIPMTLSKTPIMEYDDELVFEDMHCLQFFMSTPPSLLQNEFSLSFALNKLSTLKSNFIMSVIFHNVVGSGYLGVEKTADSLFMRALNQTAEIVSKTAKMYKENIQEKGLSQVKMSLEIAIFNEDKNEIKKDAKVIRVLDGFDGSVMLPNIFTRYDDYMAMIPSVAMQGKFPFMVSSEQFASIMMFPKYLCANGGIFEKKGSILTSFDVLEFNTTNKPGALIFAPPGSGKSALINNLYFNMFAQLPKFESLIVDFGGSYESLFHTLHRSDMTYTTMVLKDKADACFNPLDLQFGKPCDKNAINAKKSVIVMFFKVALKIDNDDFDSLIESVAEALYDSFLNGKDKIKVPHLLKEQGKSDFYIDRYIESGFTDFKSFSKAMPTITDFMQLIFIDQRIKDVFSEAKRKDLTDRIGEFLESAKLFDGNSTEYLMNTHLIVDLKEIALTNLPMLHLMLTYIIGSKLMQYMNVPDSEKGHPKVIMIDEYAQYKERSPYIDAIATTIFKTGRKENIHLILATQNISDFSKEFFNTCGRLISFSPKTATELQTLAAITDDTIDNLRPLMTNISTLKGSYSEFLVFNSDEARSKNFYRSKVIPFEYYAFITTDPRDRQKKAELAEQFKNPETGEKNWAAAIEHMANQMIQERSKGL